MKRPDVTVHVLVGLPGSGKSCFAQKLAKHEPTTCIIGENELQDLDYRCYKVNSGKRYEPMSREKLLQTIKNHLGYGYRTFILDGLFLDNDLILACLDTINESHPVKKVILDIWPDDRENCKRNDHNRRRIGSSLSIDTLTTTKVDPKVIREKYPNTTVARQSVYLLPDYAYFFRDYIQLEDESVLKSDGWSLGGTSWGYDGSSSPIEADPPMTDFKEFDKLLDEVAPTLSKLDYQAIKGACVSVEQYEDSDYYSRIQKARFVCSMEDLYDCLNHLGYINKGSEFNLTEEELEAVQALAGKDFQSMTVLEQAAWKLYSKAYHKEEQ